MLRSELISKIAEEIRPDLTHADAKAIVDLIFEEIIAALERGERVEVRGFGSFSVRKRDERPARNPRTGEAVHVEAKHVPYFKSGKRIRDRLNGKA